MNNQQVKLMESTIDFLKEKIKSYDISRTNIEQRLFNLENKYTNLSTISNRVEKQNFSSFDTQLSASHLFTSSLKKVDANCLANLKKLQDFFEQGIQQSHSKFADIQQKLMGMLNQKQKILRNMNYEIENHNHSISAIEQWIKTNHNKNNSSNILQQSLIQKLDYIQKNNMIKMETIEEKIKFLEQYRESSMSSKKIYVQDKQQISQQMKNIRQNVKTMVSDLQEKIEELKLQKNTANEKKMQQKMNQISQKYEQILVKIHDIQQNSSRHQKNQEQSQKHHFSQTKNHFKNNNNLQMNYTSNNYSQQKKKSSFENQRKYSQSNSSKKQNQPQNKHNSYIQQLSKNQKKGLPPKRNLFSAQQINDLPEEEIQIQQNMRGGIRGLLQKSKEKQREQYTRKPQPLGRNKSSSKKSLPPVKQDPLAKKKKTQNKNSHRNDIDQQQEQEVYQIDDEGYLMDEQGNYLLNEKNQMIRLSPEQIEQYMLDDQN